MLEQLKKEVYEANMLLPKIRTCHFLPGEMSAGSTERADCL